MEAKYAIEGQVKHDIEGQQGTSKNFIYERNIAYDSSIE